MGQITKDIQGYAMLLAVIALLGGLWFLYSYTKTHYNPEKRKKRVSGILRGFARPRGYRVLDHVELEGIDHVLVGYFGLLLVSDLPGEGVYYGELADSKWVCSDPPERLERGKDMRRQTIQNPLPAGERAIGLLRERLSKNGIYKLQMEHVAVISNRGSSVQITGSKGKVMNLRGLSDLLSKSKYSADAGLDIPSLCAAIEGK